MAAAQTPSPDLGPAHDPRIGQIIDSLQQTVSVRETAISPDGKNIVWEQQGQIHLAPVQDAASSRILTACSGDEKGQETEATWSPDSSRVAFFSTCTSDHKTAIFVADANGNSAPKQTAELNGFAQSLGWSPDGKTLSFIYVEGSKGPINALAPTKPPAGVIGVEGIEDQRVATVSADGGEIRQVTPASLYVYEYDWSPQANKLAFVAAPPPGDNNWWVAKLYTVEPGQEPKAVLDPGTISGSLHGLQIAVPRWSPDGKQLAFIGGLMSDQGATGGDIYLMSSDGGQPKDITAGIDSTPTWLHWLGPQQLGFSDITAGESTFQSIDVATGQTRMLMDRLPESISDGRLEMSVSLSNNGEVAFTGSSFAHAPEVYVAKLGEAPHALTHVNDDLKPLWGEAESLQWTNQGFHVQGWLLKPAHYDPAKKYPLIVYVHGGPSSANMPRWPYAGYGPVPFSALDYFVLMPNPRGSYGEGEKFTQANRKDFGYGDLRDILAGVDAAEAKYSIDNGRVGITGWSYGGFMTMFGVTQTDRFKAAVAGAGLSDWQSYYGENSIDQWMIPFFGASVYDDPAVYAKSSAIDFIKNVKTPTLVVVGSNDAECPAPQSFEFWHALRDLKAPTELVVYPGEGHGFYKPEDRKNVLERALGWFEHYMPAQ